MAERCCDEGSGGDVLLVLVVLSGIGGVSARAGEHTLSSFVVEFPGQTRCTVFPSARHPVATVVVILNITHVVTCCARAHAGFRALDGGVVPSGALATLVVRGGPVLRVGLGE